MNGFGPRNLFGAKNNLMNPPVARSLFGAMPNQGFSMSSRLNRNNPEESVCKSIWDKGVGFDPEFTIQNVIGIRSGINCNYQLNDGQYIYVRTKGLTYNEKGNRISSFLEDIPLFTQIPDSPGLYTWIVYSTPDSEEKRFAACNAYSFLELGTKHHIIGYRVGASKIHAAGEMRIATNGHITFNLESGTYMLKLFEKQRNPRCTKDDLELYILEQLKANYFGPQSLYQPGSYITKELEPSDEELNLFYKHGLLYLFSTKEECDTFDATNVPTNNNRRGGFRRMKRRKNTMRRKQKNRKSRRR